MEQFIFAGDPRIFAIKTRILWSFPGNCFPSVARNFTALFYDVDNLAFETLTTTPAFDILTIQIPTSTPLLNPNSSPSAVPKFLPIPTSTIGKTTNSIRTPTPVSASNSVTTIMQL